jgi:integrase
MGIYRRGENGIYWYRFVWQGQRIRRSTKQQNARVAAQLEAAAKTALARNEIGIRAPKRIPTLAEFTEQTFLPYVQAHFSQRLKTREYYENGCKNLKASKLATERIDAISSDKIAAYAAQRRTKKLAVSSINRELEVLRRMFRLATEWGKVEKALPPVRMIPGERRRERVISADEEERYLFNASPALLKDVVTILIECGLRPEECLRLRWDELRDGSLHIAYGKTKSARRSLPLSARVLAIIETHKNSTEWVFPAKTKSGHIEASSLRKAHYRTCKAANVERFPLYTLRHTCLTRWASHMDPYTLAYLAGHSDMATTKRYVHPQVQTVREAIERARIIAPA